MHTRSHRHDGHAPTTVVSPKRVHSIPVIDRVAERVDSRTEIDPDVRYRMISEAAYRLYEARGFEDGYDMEDWLAAEAGVDGLIARRRSEGDA